jgi:hypothetical protein
MTAVAFHGAAVMFANIHGSQACGVQVCMTFLESVRFDRPYSTSKYPRLTATGANRRTYPLTPSALVLSVLQTFQAIGQGHIQTRMLSG